MSRASKRQDLVLLPQEPKNPAVGFIVSRAKEPLENFTVKIQMKQPLIVLLSQQSKESPSRFSQEQKESVELYCIVSAIVRRLLWVSLSQEEKAHTFWVYFLRR